MTTAVVGGVVASVTTAITATAPGAVARVVVASAITYSIQDLAQKVPIAMYADLKAIYSGFGQVCPPTDVLEPECDRERQTSLGNKHCII